jgi:hypothetical protein
MMRGSMSFKRRVLGALGKDALLEIGRGLEPDAKLVLPFRGAA